MNIGNLDVVSLLIFVKDSYEEIYSDSPPLIYGGTSAIPQGHASITG